MKTYRSHRCDKTHRTHAAMARCVWGRGTRVEGTGEYAVVHWLRVGRQPSFADVLLYDSEAEAAEMYRAVSDRFYCGGSCRNAGGRHVFVRLDLGNQQNWGDK